MWKTSSLIQNAKNAFLTSKLSRHPFAQKYKHNGFITLQKNFATQNVSQLGLLGAPKRPYATEKPKSSDSNQSKSDNQAPKKDSEKSKDTEKKNEEKKETSGQNAETTDKDATATTDENATEEGKEKPSSIYFEDVYDKPDDEYGPERCPYNIPEGGWVDENGIMRGDPADFAHVPVLSYRSIGGRDIASAGRWTVTPDLEIVNPFGWVPAEKRKQFGMEPIEDDKVFTKQQLEKEITFEQYKELFPYKWKYDKDGKPLHPLPEYNSVSQIDFPFDEEKAKEESENPEREIKKWRRSWANDYWSYDERRRRHWQYMQNMQQWRNAQKLLMDRRKEQREAIRKNPEKYFHIPGINDWIDLDLDPTRLNVWQTFMKETDKAPGPGSRWVLWSAILSGLIVVGTTMEFLSRAGLQDENDFPNLDDPDLMTRRHAYEKVTTLGETGLLYRNQLAKHPKIIHALAEGIFDEDFKIRRKCWKALLSIANETTIGTFVANNLPWEKLMNPAFIFSNDDVRLKVTKLISRTSFAGNAAEAVLVNNRYAMSTLNALLLDDTHTETQGLAAIAIKNMSFLWKPRVHLIDTMKGLIHVNRNHPDEFIRGSALEGLRHLYTYEDELWNFDYVPKLKKAIQECGVTPSDIIKAESHFDWGYGSYYGTKALASAFGLGWAYGYVRWAIRSHRRGVRYDFVHRYARIRAIYTGIGSMFMWLTARSMYAFSKRHGDEFIQTVPYSWIASMTTIVTTTGLVWLVTRAIPYSILPATVYPVYYILTKKQRPSTEWEEKEYSPYR